RRLSALRGSRAHLVSSPLPPIRKRMRVEYMTTPTADTLRWRMVMFLSNSSIGAVALTAALALAVTGAAAHDEAKYPDWAGQWKRPRGLATQWDQTKLAGLAQQAPLTPEYQKRLEASIADQRNGGQGADNRYTCITNGMPRVMGVIFPIEFVILPSITYIHFEAFMPRRIYTDGRDFPVNEEPSFMGYSIGQWSDSDGDGRFDTL